MTRLGIILGGENFTRFTGVNNMIEATDALSGYLKANGSSFAQSVNRRK